MHIELLKYVLADGLTRTTLEQDVVGHDDGAPAVDIEQRFHMLKEVELLVLRSSPEVLAFVGVGLALQPSRFVHDLDAALLPEWWISEYHREPLTRVTREAVNTRTDRARIRVDPV